MLRRPGCDCDLTCLTKPTLSSSQLPSSGFFLLIHHPQPREGLLAYDLLQWLGSGFPWWVKCWWGKSRNLVLLCNVPEISHRGWGPGSPASFVISAEPLIMTASFCGASSDDKSEASNRWLRRTSTCSGWRSGILWYSGLLLLFVSHSCSRPSPAIQRDFPHYLEPASLIVGSLLLWLYLHIFSPLVNEFPWTSVHCQAPGSAWVVACLPPVPHASSVHRAGSVPPPPAHGTPLHRQARSTTGPILFSLALLSPEKSVAHNPGRITFERVSGPNAGSWQTEAKIKGRRI